MPAPARVSPSISDVEPPLGSNSRATEWLKHLKLDRRPYIERGGGRLTGAPHRGSVCFWPGFRCRIILAADYWPRWFPLIRAPSIYCWPMRSSAPRPRCPPGQDAKPLGQAHRRRTICAGSPLTCHPELFGPFLPYPEVRLSTRVCSVARCVSDKLCIRISNRKTVCEYLHGPTNLRNPSQMHPFLTLRLLVAKSLLDKTLA